MIFNVTKYVYVLQIRYSGNEDDVYVFSTREKAEAMVYEFFEHIEEPRMKLDDFEEYLFSQDIGYFTIERQEIQ
tara:strand:+ start:381 stop:602 length:222 start_codon:yes stop_codon:yes gene_type:complete